MSVLACHGPNVRYSRRGRAPTGLAAVSLRPACPRRRGRSARRARPRTRTPPRRAGAPTARPAGAGRRDRRRSRGGRARFDARFHRSAGSSRWTRQLGAACRARVDPVAGTGEIRLEPQVRRRVAERPAPLIAGDDDTVELERPAEHRRCGDDVPFREGRTNRRRRHALDLRRYQHVEAEALEQRQIARAPDTEPEILACDNALGSDRAEEELRERLGRELLELRSERSDDDGLDPRFVEELEAAFERRQDLDLVAEGNARVRVERDDGLLEAGLPEGSKDGDGPGARRRSSRSQQRVASARASTGRRRPSRQPRERVFRRDDHLGIGLVDGERPDLGSAQRPAVPAERLGDRADVGAGGDVELEPRDARLLSSRSSCTCIARTGISTATPCRWSL